MVQSTNRTLVLAKGMRREKVAMDSPTLGQSDSPSHASLKYLSVRENDFQMAQGVKKQFVHVLIKLLIHICTV